MCRSPGHAVLTVPHGFHPLSPSPSASSDKPGVGYLVCSGVILMTTSITTARLRGITHSGDKMKSQVHGTVLIAIVRFAPGGNTDLQYPEKLPS